MFNLGRVTQVARDVENFSGFFNTSASCVSSRSRRALGLGQVQRSYTLATTKMEIAPSRVKAYNTARMVIKNQMAVRGNVFVTECTARVRWVARAAPEKALVLEEHPGESCWRPDVPLS
jgi:hypothetical protein